VAKICNSCAHDLASLFASLLPILFVCGVTFLMMILCGELLRAFMMCVTRRSSGWLIILGRGMSDVVS
jgi:hypothetical protein